MMIPHTHFHPSVVKEQRERRKPIALTVMQVESVGVRATSEDFRTASRSPGSTHRSRKEVIQPQVPLRLPCYDFAPVTELTFDGCLLAVSPPASGPPSFHGVTG